MSAAPLDEDMHIGYLLGQMLITYNRRDRLTLRMYNRLHHRHPLPSRNGLR